MTPTTKTRTPRVPPHDIEAEEAVLGAMLLDQHAVGEALAILDADEFYRPSHELIYQAIRDMSARGDTIDALTVANELHARGQLDEVGGKPYLATLAGEAITTSNVAYYARLVSEHARARLALTAFTYAAERVYEGGTADEALAELEARVTVIPRGSTGSRFRLHTISALRSLPPPRDLVEGIISQNVLATLWGPSGHGKSLLALDMALSVATGHPWYGHAVEAGPVVMVVAEGVSATPDRIDAWLADRGEREPDDFFVVAEAVNLFREGDPETFLRAVHDACPTPKLVIFDTLARSMVGAEENSARDLGVVISAGDLVRSKTGAAVMFVHHSGRNAEHERGSTALYGACDTVISAIRNEDGITEIQCRKQKDREYFETFGVVMSPVEKSVVLRPESGGTTPLEPPPSAIQILGTLWHSFGTKPTSGSAWLDASSVSKRTYYRARKFLVDAGFVSEEERGRSSYFTITSKGEELFVP